jgi:hypothetical protein
VTGDDADADADDELADAEGFFGLGIEDGDDEGEEDGE